MFISRLAVALVCLIYVFAAVCLVNLAAGASLEPQFVLFAAALVLVFARLVPPLWRLAAWLAFWQRVGLRRALRRPDPKRREALLAAWRDVLTLCKLNSARYPAVVYCSRPGEEPWVAGDMVFLPDWLGPAAALEDRAVLMHEAGHLAFGHGRWSAFNLVVGWLAFFALVPVRVAQFIVNVLTAIPFVNFIALPLAWAYNLAGSMLCWLQGTAVRASHWAAEYQADRFVKERGFGLALARALNAAGCQGGTMTHPPLSERVRRLVQN